MISKKRVVAVDDSNVVLKTLKNVLDKEEYEFHPFSTGTRAVEYLVQKDKIPDLIILDIEMPGMNGYEVLERIKKMKHLESVPVIFLTSDGEKKQVIKAVTGGIKDYVVKPIDKDILQEKIQTLLKK
ncbi:MAG: response regulator [Acetatifactor sp.]|nr:response regulator [Acetatifactor sp.]